MADLFAWGANSHGQLGLGFQSEQADNPEVVNLAKSNLNPLDINKITGGAGHTLILDVAGRVHSCGWNNRGQTGIPEHEVILHFTTVDIPERIIDICCGWDSSMALTDTGRVLGWGSNSSGQLGVPKDVSGEPYKPRYVDINGKIKKIAMGLKHSVAVTEDGRVFATGAGNKGQLGLVDHNNMQIHSTDTFTEVMGIQDVIDASCGQYFTMALTKNGDIYAWGSNKHGQLGVDCRQTLMSCTPVKIDTHFGSVVSIATGWTHSSILTGDGRIFSWGRADYGQLGSTTIDRDHWEMLQIQNFDEIRQLCVGSEHSIALDACGRIFSWGWNEHGNCGNGKTENVFHPETIEILPKNKYHSILIGSGAAYCFTVVKIK